MDINELTIGQAKELAAMLGGASSEGLNSMKGQKCIVRTYSAGVWFGEISEKSGDEVIVKTARRLWRWKAKESISLSAVAVHGVDSNGCKFAPAVESIWLQAIEIIPCTTNAIKSIEGVEDVEVE